ncbi:hypothetical protein [Zobellia roscoffensis]|uniref:hypothetical protein n=1 Tax=Zobellia roscoffensis TaxID=2779508 RepID=UPI00188C2B54|nr:hypothetical protein [Zobellia roscoffensis]
MSLKNILIGFVVFIFLIAGIIYLAFRTKTKDLSKQFPYNEIIDKTLTTKQPAYIAANYEHFVEEHPYIIEMDTTHFYGTIDSIYTLPIGTPLKIEGANAYTKPVSGSTHPIVLGSVFVKELDTTVKFEFYWGENPTYGLYEHKDNYDIYPLAPWQEGALPFKYFWDGRTEPHDWETWDLPLEN